MGCDAGFCGFEVDVYADFYCVKTVSIRKPRKCSECGRDFPKGKQMNVHSGKCEGELFRDYICVDCAEISKAFYKPEAGCAVPAGELWEEMRIQAFPDLTTACFDKLTSASAKQYLRERWMKWKGIAA